MVLYFSATGNTQYIAQLIADKLADQTTDLLERLRAGDHSAIHSDSPFVICLPVYVGDIPCFIMECLNSTPLKGSGKIYFVYTCAGYTSSGFRHAKKIAGTKGMEYGGSLSVQMPNNYVASNLNGIPDDAKIKELIAAAEPVTDEIAATIRRGGTLKSRQYHTGRTCPLHIHILVLAYIHAKNKTVLRHEKLHRLRTLRKKMPSWYYQNDRQPSCLDRQ